jgi:hypothetical protein
MELVAVRPATGSAPERSAGRDVDRAGRGDACRVGVRRGVALPGWDQPVGCESATGHCSLNGPATDDDRTVDDRTVDDPGAQPPSHQPPPDHDCQAADNA